MDHIKNILNDFDKVDLIQLDMVNWMNRKDTKFVFPFVSLPVLLNELKKDYSVLCIENKTKFNYKTFYFDTINFDMYQDHHNGRATRFKVRERIYSETNERYLEVKKKDNKGHTIKDRILIVSKQDRWLDRENDFLKLKIPYDPLTLFASISVKYSRITLVNKLFNEKLTIDLDLEFLNGSDGYKINDLVIAELKQLSVVKTPAFMLFKNLHIKPITFSKYCFGINYLYPGLKKNNFKQKLVTLKKIINDGSIYLTPGI